MATKKEVAKQKAKFRKYHRAWQRANKEKVREYTNRHLQKIVDETVAKILAEQTEQAETKEEQ